MTAYCLDDILHQMDWTDAALLEEVRSAIHTDASAIPRNPAWGTDYDPLTILANPESEPEHELIALVNLRIALHPDEAWGKCANCGNIYCQGGERGDTVCSDGCWEGYARYIAAETGTPLSQFGLEEEPRDIAFHGFGGDRIEGNPYGRDL